MRHFLLITNVYKDKELVLTKRIVSYIQEKGGTASYLITNAGHTEQRDYELSEIPEDTECILVLGGDGTLIRAATKTESKHIPLIGVNLGTLGYLCELEEATVFPAIDELMADHHITEERMMLNGHLSGSDEVGKALNDVVIHPMGNLTILSLNVYVNGAFLTTYHADGIILATPTGSTGYNMSAGGPIVDPKTRMILLTPSNAHNLNSKSIVLSADDVIEIELTGRSFQKEELAHVSFDGDLRAQIAPGQRFVVTAAKDTVGICKLSNKSFLEILRKKMETYT